MEPFIYLDYNATTPVDPRVADAMKPYLTGFFGNPSSTHRFGREARLAVENARSQVAACLGASEDEIVFTSGGTESNNMAIRGVVAALGGGHIITSAVEHPAVLEVVKALDRLQTIRLTVLPVDTTGMVHPDAVAQALSPDTILVSVMLANNEVGTLQPIREIAALCHNAEVLLHTDAAQAMGKIEVDVEELGVDLLSVAGHKLYAPKGIGALYLRRGTPMVPLLHGAGHERGLRPGTENILEQVGLGAASELVRVETASELPRMAQLRDRLAVGLSNEFPKLFQHGHPTLRLPNTLSAVFPGFDAGAALETLTDRLGASVGAACHSDRIHSSHVLEAMNVSPGDARGTLRLSVGRFTTTEEVDAGVALLTSAFKGLILS